MSKWTKHIIILILKLIITIPFVGCVIYPFIVGFDKVPANGFVICFFISLYCIFDLVESVSVPRYEIEDEDEENF